MKITDLKNYKVIAPATEPLLGEKLAEEKGFDILDNPITRGIQSVFPGQKIGESIGTLAGLGIEKAKGVLGGQDNSATFDISAPSPLQVGGDIASGALNVAGFKGAGTIGNLGQRILKMAGIGGGIAGSDAIADGESVTDVAKSTVVGGAIGGSLPIAGAGLRAIGRQVQTLPDRFLNSAFGRSKQQIAKDIASGSGDTLNKFILKNKSIGTANSLLKESADAVGTLGEEIQTKLSSAVRTTGSKITIGRDNFIDTIVNTPEAKGALMGRKEIVDIVQRLAPQTKQILQKPSMNLEEANKLRQLLDSTLGDKAFLGGQLTNDKVILKAFADNLRETVKTKAPKVVRGLFSELSHEIQLRDALLDRIAQKSKNQVLSIGDVFGGALGGIVGGGIPGAALGVGIRRGIESVPFKIGAAKFTEALTKASPILEQLTPAQQTVILDLFSSLFDSAEDDQPQDQ